MPRRNESLVENLIEAPWWVSVIVAAVAFVGLRFVIPATFTSPMFVIMAHAVSSFAGWVFLFFMVIAGLSALLAWRRGELFKGQSSLASLYNLSWRSLEDLVGEAYRQNGYSVMGNMGPGSDGGVDLIARKGGETVLVQCKHWKGRKVGVKTIREMFGLLNAERANEVHVVSSGYFTDDAEDFARHKPIKLINGPMLLQMVRKAQSPLPAAPARSTSRVICPRCGSDMTLKVAGRGGSKGREFWSCEKFPLCKGTRDVPVRVQAG